MDEQIKIWQRVRSDGSNITDGLPGLAAGSLARAALYNALARQLQGPGRGIFLALQEDEQQCVRYLQGIYRLAMGSKMQLSSLPPSGEKLEPALRKCYGQSLKALMAFEQRIGNPEYGPVFAMMAGKMRENCCRIANLLGL